MAEKDDIQNLANQFLELWQKQLDATFRDPELISRTLGVMQQAQRQLFEEGMKTHATASTPDKPVSPHSNLAVHEFDRRLSAVEQRLAALESLIGKGSGSAKAKIRKSKR